MRHHGPPHGSGGPVSRDRYTRPPSSSTAGPPPSYGRGRGWDSPHQQPHGRGASYGGGSGDAHFASRYRADHERHGRGMPGHHGQHGGTHQRHHAPHARPPYAGHLSASHPPPPAPHTPSDRGAYLAHSGPPPTTPRNTAAPKPAVDSDGEDLPPRSELLLSISKVDTNLAATERALEKLRLPGHLLGLAKASSTGMLTRAQRIRLLLRENRVQARAVHAAHAPPKRRHDRLAVADKAVAADAPMEDGNAAKSTAPEEEQATDHNKLDQSMGEAEDVNASMGKDDDDDDDGNDDDDDDDDDDASSPAFPTFASVQEFPCYARNLAHHAKVAHLIAATVRRRRVEEWEKKVRLTEMWRKLAVRWLDRCEKRRARVHLPSEEEEESAGLATLTSSGGAVRSDWEMAQLLEQMRELEYRRKRHLGTLAPSVDMLMRRKWARKFAYNDTNGLQQDPEAVERARVHEPWSEREKAIFERKFIAYPKQFGKIATYLPYKNTGDVIAHYYLVKRRIHLKQKQLRARRRAARAPPVHSVASNPQVSRELVALGVMSAEDVQLYTPRRSCTVSGSVDVAMTASGMQPWVRQEKELFVQAISEHGTEWSSVAATVGSRTADECVEYYRRNRRRLGLQKYLPSMSDLATAAGDRAGTTNASGSVKRSRGGDSDDSSGDGDGDDDGDDNRDSKERKKARKKAKKKARKKPKKAKKKARKKARKASTSSADGGGGGGGGASTSGSTGDSGGGGGGGGGGSGTGERHRKSRTKPAVWTSTERERFTELLRDHGRAWTVIAAKLGTKTVPQVRNFYQNNKTRMGLATLVQESGSEADAASSNVEADAMEDMVSGAAGVTAAVHANSPADRAGGDGPDDAAGADGTQGDDCAGGDAPADDAVDPPADADTSTPVTADVDASTPTAADDAAASGATEETDATAAVAEASSPSAVAADASPAAEPVPDATMVEATEPDPVPEGMDTSDVQ